MAHAARSFELIRALIHDGHYAEALTVGEHLTQDETRRRFNTLFIEALILKHQGELESAAARMRDLLSENPSFARVRHELAHTLYLMGDADGALYHFEFLARTVTVESQQSLYDRYLISIRRQRPWTFESTIGFAPSTNINNGTRTRTVYVGDIPFQTDDTERSGIGVAYSLAGTWRFDIDKQTAVTLGGSVRGQEYRGAAHDQGLAESFIEFSKRQQEWMWGIGLTADRLLVGWNGYRQGVGPYLSARWDIGRMGIFAGRLSRKERRYDQAPTFNGSESELSLRYRYAFTPRLFVTGTLIGSDVKTQLEYSSFRSLAPSIMLDYAVHRGVILHTGISHEQRRYQANFPLMGQRRKDERTDYTLAATLPSLSFGGFSPRISYGYQVTDSNVKLYDRRRQSIALLLVKQY